MHEAEGIGKMCPGRTAKGGGRGADQAVPDASIKGATCLQCMHCFVFVTTHDMAQKSHHVLKANFSCLYPE